MDNTNSKTLTLSFAIVAGIGAITIHMLLKAFAGAFGVVARATDTDLVRHGLPVVAGLAIFAALQFNRRVLVWGDEVVGEIRKVVWPTRKDVVAMTIVVIVMVLISSMIITSFDFVSGYFIRLLTNN